MLRSRVAKCGRRFRLFTSLSAALLHAGLGYGEEERSPAVIADDRVKAATGDEAAQAKEAVFPGAVEYMLYLIGAGVAGANKGFAYQLSYGPAGRQKTKATLFDGMPNYDGPSYEMPFSTVSPALLLTGAYGQSQIHVSLNFGEKKNEGDYQLERGMGLDVGYFGGINVLGVFDIDWIALGIGPMMHVSLGNMIRVEDRRTTADAKIGAVGFASVTPAASLIIIGGPLYLSALAARTSEHIPGVWTEANATSIDKSFGSNGEGVTDTASAQASLNQVKTREIDFKTAMFGIGYPQEGAFATLGIRYERRQVLYDVKGGAISWRKEFERIDERWMFGIGIIM